MAQPGHYDVIVIGAGPAGYIGAIRAGQLGLRTACIERDKLGGVCLNWGCIPSKALLHNAELYREAVTNGAEWGIEFEKAKVNWKQVIARSRGITEIFNKGVGFLFKKNKVDHVKGHARMVSGRTAGGPCRVEVSKPTGDYYHGSGSADVTETLTADNVIIATGAAPKALPFAPFDGKTIVSSYDAMNLPKQPKSMVIVGSGAIGMEFAYFFNAFGTKVTVVEILDRVLPVEDDDVCKLAKRIFTKQGMDILTGHSVKAIDVKTPGKARVTIVDAADESKSRQVDCDVVLVAVGVGARFDGLFDDGLGVAIENGHIRTDYRDAAEPTYATSVPGLYAVGDVIGAPWLAHLAMEEAVVCVERIAGHQALSIDYGAIPGCTYCNPQIASIGLTERAVRQQGIEYSVGTYGLKSHGKAVAVGAGEGMVKILTSKPYGEILGAHIIGQDASELIAEIGLAKRLEATAEDIISTIHAHPTMSEAIHEAALATQGRALHA
ncbi:MAG: dihydrolipoyl dehydrogenase [Phycisphaerales bacterium]